MSTISKRLIEIVAHRRKDEFKVILLHGPVVPAEFEGDGCTCAPDVVLGIDIRSACRIHDWECRKAHEMGKIAQFFYRRGIDKRLRKNVFLIMRAGGATYAERRLVSFAYFLGVRPTGWWFFRRGSLEGYREHVKLDINGDPKTVWLKEDA